MATAGEASLSNASAVIDGLRRRQWTTSNDKAGEDETFAAMSYEQQPATAAPAWRSPEDLAAARRSAFLGGSDSMAGLKAARGVLSEELTNRGGDPGKGGAIPSMKFLEQELSKLGPYKGIKADQQGQWTTSNDKAGEDATLAAMSFDPQQPTAASGSRPNAANLDAVDEIALNPQTPQLAPSGNLPQAAVNEWMQKGLSEKLRASNLPLDQVASWQLTQQPIQALRQDPGREATLAAFAARGEKPPTTEGEALLAVGAGNAFGTRGGQFKPGNTANLGFLDPSKLAPLNSLGRYSGHNPGNQI